MYRPTRALFGLLIAALGPVRLEGPLPFSAAELDDALSLRVGAGVPVEVDAAAPGEALVRAGGKERSISLGDARGPAAARLVALVVVDLTTDVTPLPAPPPPPAPPPEIHITAPPAPAGPPLARIALLGGPTGGSNLDGVRFAFALDATFHLVSNFRLAVGAGFAPGPDATVGAIPVTLRTVPLRAALAWQPRGGPFELRLGAVVVPYGLTSSTMPAVARNGAVAGGSAAALYSVELGSRFDLVLAAGADAFANRDEFQIHGERALATNRLALWGALGVGWRASP